MDRFDAMRLFVRIVERQSFSSAAADLGVPRSTATQGIKDLETRLGVRLLQRTTRQVRPTVEGETYYQQCLSILADVEDVESGLGAGPPKGLLKVDLHGSLARHFIFPGLHRFIAAYPQVELRLSEGGESVDLVRDGVDCLLRSGSLSDRSAIGRQIALMTKGTFASPAYVATFGLPTRPDRLQGHRSVGFSGAKDEAMPLRFTVKNKIVPIALPSIATVTSPESNVALGRLGLGLIQVPRYRVRDDLLAGTLVEVLGDYPPPPLPVHVVYSHRRHVSARLRVFIDWMATEFATRLAELPECRSS
ncbi:LysR family transcriptional regulator [Aureimonas leprariae]|uniref:LysR family transcriptional regulator n=1 Tax=Plantimonas leprariae TaxID=2615207 RepID=A0A7V7PKM0_9HYPH|nr:LysR family transcriptional regulator [Aureimonas leprariae]KAB0676441.1 LysR family transcriptional regulator [Aureimonas leprariae]